MKGNRGKIITIVSAKGGVGKTILTLNLAGIFSILEYKTLVIDLDLFNGDIATYINSNIKKTIFSLANDINNLKYKNFDDYLHKYNDYLYILNSSINPLESRKININHIEKILNTAQNNFDIILIDTGNIYNEVSIIAMDNSDSILHVFTNDSFDLKNTANFISLIKNSTINNFYTLLNESSILNKNYFSPYEMRNIIKHNIDFVLSDSFYIKNIDKYIMNGEIIILNKKIKECNKKEYIKMKNICNQLIKKGDGKYE